MIKKRIRTRYLFLNSRFTIFEELKDRLIFVNPQKINLMYVTSNVDYPTRDLSGAVVNDNFFSDSLIPLRLHPKIRYCTAHWGYGNSWEESGAIDYYQQMFKRFNSSFKLAKTTFKGRNYFAWYSIEIPINSGPYKFNGLPGLVVELFDSKKHYH